MEVKPGYKQTEVGVIPGDWEVKSLDSLCAAIVDCHHSTPIWTDTGAIVIRNQNIRDGKLDLSAPSFTDEAHFVERTRRAIPSFGDLIITREAPMGLVCMIPESLQCCLGQRMVLLRINKGVADNFYFLYALLSENVQKIISIAGGTGSTVSNLRIPSIKALPIILPPQGEQGAIASALSDMDALLDGLDCLIAKKRAIKLATMQQLLTGQTRLPGFSGEWEVKRLGALADIRSGGTPSTGDAGAWDGTIPWCTPTDITALEGGKYLTTTNRAITEHGLSTSSAELIPARSIVMTSRATIGECAINAVPVTTNQGFKNLVPHDSIDVEFLYYLLSTRTQGLIGLSAGSTFLEIGKTQLRQYEVKLPAEKDEQTAIATVLSDMDAEITALETRRAKTRALKQAMMQELLTGRTRLVMPDAKPVGEEAAQTEGRKANVHFLRSVLAAEIIDQLHDQPTFGHVKFEKMMFLAEHLCQVDTGSTYHRKAAGPYDNRALRSIDSQLQKQQWFEARKQEGRYQYVPLAKRGGHKPYFERHFSGIGETLEKILSAFKTAKTEQCEIVATLLAAWSDLLREKGTVSDEMIVHEVLHNWHEAKQRIPENRWLTALGWMREKGFVPKGVTLP
jgi:restriction endonuclease S subunit